MAVYSITYERASILDERTSTDSILWVTPSDWDLPTTRKHFEKTQNCIRVLDISFHSHEP